MKNTVSLKADRLVQNHRVILFGPNQAVVIGDHDTYTVEKRVQAWSCTCPWARFRGHWSHCSHIVAVKRAQKNPASQTPVARLAEMLNDRHQNAAN